MPQVPLTILWLDPFHGGSHAAVASGYAAHSTHRVSLLTLSTAGGWRWRMRGGAVTLARLVRERNLRPDLLVASDMLDLATFRALSADTLAGVPAALYLHENQLTYPLPPGRQRDLSFAWINYTAALSADALLFNSDFHRRELLAALPKLLGRYYDHQELASIELIAAKSHVLPPGIDLATLDGPAPPVVVGQPPVILWSARWEYDKQPEVFFNAIETLAERGLDFHLIIAGEHIDPDAPAFAAARTRWAAHLLHWGYAPTREDYAALLRRADLVVSTARQEYFGVGIVEAIACGCAPLLPRRLNYPDLLPPEHHAACLYNHDRDLPAALASAVSRVGSIPRSTWRAIAAPYDWTVMAPRYDALLAALVRNIVHR